MKDLILVVFFLFFLITIGFLWANRASDKVFTALVVALTTSLATGTGALFVSLKSEKISDKFLIVFIYDKKENKPILSKTHPLNKRFGTCGTIWAFSDQELVKKNSTNLSGLLMDFWARCIVQQWVMLYQHPDGKLPEFQTYNWSPNHTTTFPYYIEESKGFLTKKVPFDEILQIFENKKNIFSSNIIGLEIFSLLLPRNTVFSYSSDNSYRILKLHNSFVEYTINIRQISSVALTNDYYNLVKIDPEYPERYELASFALNTEAQFSGWRSGFPSMKLYKYWINSLNLLFKNKFDWRPCLAEIKEEWAEEMERKRRQSPFGG